MTRTRNRTHPGGGERGFTLMELLMTLALLSILFGLAALALGHFWRVQSLEGGQDEVLTQLRNIQQRVVSETHPLVYGARFSPGASSWQNIQYNPDTGVCKKVQDGDLDGGEFSGGVEFQGASFDPYVDGAVNVTEECTTGAFSDAAVVFFFARGSATEGDVTIVNPSLSRTKTVCVSGTTARVELEGEGSC
jgi:prepilin-type N-terminal cleavage/methylation domain-containing protein